MTAAAFGGGVPSAEDEPDAVARGWVERPDGTRNGALFFLANESLGVGRTDVAEPPEWYDLRSVKGLDALGDPHDGALEVELAMDDGRAVHASWPEAFCDQVVSTLLATTSSPSPVPAAGPAPRPAPTAAPASPVDPTPPADAPVPAPGSAAGSLVRRGTSTPSTPGSAGAPGSTVPTRPPGSSAAADADRRSAVQSGSCGSGGRTCACSGSHRSPPACACDCTSSAG